MVSEGIKNLLADDALHRKAMLELLGDKIPGDFEAVYNRATDSFLREFVYKTIDYYYPAEVDFYDLLENSEVMLAPLLKVGAKHHREETRPDYLFSALKTSLLCSEKMLIDSNLDRQEVVKYISNVRKIYDAYEIVCIGSWYTGSINEMHQQLEDCQRQLKQMHLKFSSLMDSLSYPVLITDNSGLVLDLNKPAKRYFAVRDTLVPKHIFALLDYHYISFGDFLDSYSHSAYKAVRFTNGDQFMSTLSKINKITYMVTFEPLILAEEIDSFKARSKKLTQAETNIFSYITGGYSTKQIAQELGVSEDTVKTHRKNIRRKLGLVDKKRTLAKIELNISK